MIVQIKITDPPFSGDIVCSITFSGLQCVSQSKVDRVPVLCCDVYRSQQNGN